MPNAGAESDTAKERRLLATQNRVLELIATRRPFQEILDNICLLIENLSEGSSCSILLLDKDGRRLRAGAGPSEYMDVLDGLYIGENVGSCGTAAFRGESVIAADVYSDSHWVDYRGIADRFDIRSCWSTPFFSSTGSVLGTFAITHSYACAPTPYQEQLLETASYLAGIAMENNRFEVELIKSQKLEAIALLAGGIAHDFNNLLTAIMGNVSLAKSPGKSAEDVQRLLSAAEDASLRARDVTQQLLTFARGGAPLTATEFVSDIVRETADFVLSGSNVSCEIASEGAVKQVEVDRGQVSQVIQNVILNAVQAMPEGGVIRIHEETLVHEADGVLPLEPGEYVRVAIADQGIGIGPEHLPRIFDPYFSTKDDGRGLGLAASYSIMKKHGGCIDVSSDLGVGSTFYLYFPVSLSQPNTPDSDPDLKTRFDRTVLIMDDDASVRQVLGEMLETLGCRVEFAENGEQTVDMYAERHARKEVPDLVVLDLTVPGAMGGVDTLARLRAIDSNVRAIATSGYATDPVLADPGARGFAGRLEKPYRVVEVKKLLESVMVRDETAGTERDDDVLTRRAPRN